MKFRCTKGLPTHWGLKDPVIPILGGRLAGSSRVKWTEDFTKLALILTLFPQQSRSTTQW